MTWFYDSAEAIQWIFIVEQDHTSKCKGEKLTLWEEMLHVKRLRKRHIEFSDVDKKKSWTFLRSD